MYGRGARRGTGRAVDVRIKWPNDIYSGGLKIAGRGLHSSTFRLNVSTLCGIRRVHYFRPVS